MLWITAAFAQDPTTEPFDRYQASRLDVVETGVTTVYAPGYDGSHRFWFVVDHQGDPVDVTEFADRIGDHDVALEIRHSRRLQLGGAVALGIASAGVFGASFADPGFIVVGAPVGALGVASGTWLLSRSLRKHHPAAAYSEDQARERVEAYNWALRDQIFGP